MTITTVTMPSVTHAIKAKRVFASSGYKSEIKRASGISGGSCTHVLIVNGEPEEVMSILNRNNVEYGKIINDNAV